MNQDRDPPPQITVAPLSCRPPSMVAAPSSFDDARSIELPSSTLAASIIAEPTERPRRGRSPFPFFEHLHDNEARVIEAWRLKNSDGAIVAMKNESSFRLPGRFHYEIVQYIKRNPRRASDAA